MIIRKLAPDNGFTQLRNTMLEDEVLSFRARGVLGYLLSRPDGWETDSTRLAEKGKEGREAIRTALRELETTGYLKRTKRQAERGRWVTETLVADHRMPHDLNVSPQLDADWG